MQEEVRTVLVTGGAKGLGRYLTKAFHDRGDHIVIAARQDNGVAAEFGARVRFVACDVKHPAELHAAAQAACDWTGRLDVFVNNAGYSGWRAAGDVDEEFWDEMVATNLKGVFFGCQAAAARMQAGGVIINISSLAGKRGTSNNSVYCATKFGVNGLTQALSKELGPRGIRVNAVCPVLVRTQGLLTALALPDSPAAIVGVETFLANFAQSQSALGRLPDGAEVAAYCLFLSSPAASAITGQCINVDCGVLPQ